MKVGSMRKRGERIRVVIVFVFRDRGDWGKDKGERIKAKG